MKNMTALEAIKWEFHGDLKAAERYCRRVSYAFRQDGNTGEALIHEHLAKRFADQYAAVLATAAPRHDL